LLSKLLSIAVLGGLLSLPGTIVAAVILGVVESVVAATISPDWSAFSFLVVLFAVLIIPAAGPFRPTVAGVPVTRLGAASRISAARISAARIRPAGAGRAVAFVAVLAVLPFIMGQHWQVNLLLFTVMYAGLASSWNLLGGYAGYPALGHAAFFGVGAYAMAICTTHLGVGGGYRPFLLIAPIAVGTAVAVLPLARLLLRTRAAAFAVLSITVMFMVQTLTYKHPQPDRRLGRPYRARRAVSRWHLRAALLLRDGNSARDHRCGVLGGADQQARACPQRRP